MPELTAEQKARVEKNRQEALARRARALQLQAEAEQADRANHEQERAERTTQEQRERIEKNRAEALAKRAKLQHAFFQPKTPQTQTKPAATDSFFKVAAASAGAAAAAVASGAQPVAEQAESERAMQPVTESAKTEEGAADESIVPGPAASSSSAVSRALDGLLACAPDRAVMHYTRLVTGLEEDGGLEAFKSALEYRLDSTIETCVEHFEAEDEDVVIQAIKLAGRISFNQQICRDMSGSTIKKLINSLTQLAGDSESKKVRATVMWYMSMQSFTQAQAAKVVPAMLQAVCQATSSDLSSASLQTEGLKALEKLLTDFPAKVVLQSTASDADNNADASWWRVVYGNFAHAKDTVRSSALGLAERAASLIPEMSSEQRERVHEDAMADLVAEDNGILRTLDLMLTGKKKDAAKDACAAWGWMARFCGPKIVKDGHSSSFLKVMESAFAHKTPSIRQAAFQSWVHLACVFDDMNSTLSHPKRLELICRPFRTSWPKDSSIDVRRTAAIAWSHVLLLLSRRGTIEKGSTFDVAFASVLRAVVGETDHSLRILMIDIVGGLLFAKNDLSSTVSLVVVKDVAALNLMLRLDFVHRKCKDLFDILMELGTTDNEAERMHVTQAWTALVGRIVGDESRDAVEATARSLVLYWTTCMLGDGTVSESGDEDNVKQTRRAAALHFIHELCAHPSVDRFLFLTSTALHYAPLGTASQAKDDKVKLAAYLAGAVSIATAKENRELGVQILEKIFVLFPSNDPRAYKQLFEVVENLANGQGTVCDATLPIRFWIEAATAYSNALDASRNLVASPGVAKAHAAVIPLVLAQVQRLLAGNDVQLSEAVDQKQLQGVWAVLFDQLRDVTKSKSTSHGRHGLAAALKVCASVWKNGAGLSDLLPEASIRHLDFILSTMMDEAHVDVIGTIKAKTALQVPADHPFQSLFELWALACRCALRAVEEKRINVSLLKSIISRLLPILEYNAGVEAQDQGHAAQLAVLVTPISKCLLTCSRQGSAGPGGLGRPGTDGIVDETEAVWTKMVETVLKKASLKNVANLSPMLVAALSHTNSKIQCQAVECWNANFGDDTGYVDLPAKLQYCLKKLAKRVQITLPQKNVQSVTTTSTTINEDAGRSDSSSSNDDSQMGVPGQAPAQPALHKSPVRLPGTQTQGKGSLLSVAKRAGSRSGSLKNTPSCSPAKAEAINSAARLSSSERTEVKDQLLSEDARDVDYVQIANAKRKLLLTEHQREALREQKMHKTEAGIAYSALEDTGGESRFASMNVGEMLVMPSDSCTGFDTNTNH